MEVQLSKRFIAILAGMLAIVALLAGCGSSESGEESTAKPETTAKSDAGDGAANDAPALTKAEFIKQGDEICANASTVFAEGIEDFMSDHDLDPSEPPSDEDEEALVAEVIVPAYKQQAEELGELGPPKGEEQQVEEIVSGYEDVVAEGEADPSSLTGEDDPFADVKAKASEFGLKFC
jgi:hypothetical protein